MSLAVYIHSPSPFLAVEIKPTHKLSARRVTRTRVARSARGVLVRFDSDVAACVKVALASATPIGDEAAPVLYLELEPVGGSGRSRIELRSTRVDDRGAEMD